MSPAGTEPRALALLIGARRLVIIARALPRVIAVAPGAEQPVHWAEPVAGTDQVDDVADALAARVCGTPGHASQLVPKSGVRFCTNELASESLSFSVNCSKQRLLFIRRINIPSFNF